MTSGDALYRWLLRAFPARIRAAHGEDMARVFALQRRELAGRPVALAALWMRAVADALGQGLRCRWRDCETTGILPLRWIAEGPRHVAYALRMMRRAPGLTLTAVATLALGIGANAAIFSVVDAAFFARYPIDDPERLIRLYGEDLPRGTRQLGFSLPKFELFRRHQTAFSDIAAANYNAVTWVRGAEAEQLACAATSADFLQVFGVRPIAGRFFQAHEETGVRLVVLGEELWRTRFGADPQVMGQTLTLSGHPYTVVGVAPRLPAFWDAQVWLTEPFEVPGFSRELLLRGITFLSVIGRVRPELTHEHAAHDVARLASAYRESHRANADSAWSSTTVALRDDIVGTSRSSLLILLAAVGLLLIVACANVANLQLVRMTDRRQELAMRRALGASRGGLVRQLVTESVMLSAIAAIVGAGVARLAMPALLTLASNNLAFAADIHLSLSALAASAALSVLAGVVVGLYPAFQASRLDVTSALRDGGRTLAGSARAHAAQRTFVAAQQALSFVLIVGAALLVTTFVRLRHQDAGFDGSRVFVAGINLPLVRYPDATAQHQLYERLAAMVAATPGVERATMAQMVPLSGPFTRAPFAVNEGLVPPLSERPLGLTESVLPGYFATVGIPLKQGRDFTERDTATSPLVAVVSESTARRLFPNGDPIGRHVIMGSQGGGEVMEIVGVVGDTRSQTLRQIAEVEFYRPVTQRPRTFMRLVVRTSGDPAAFEATARRLVASADPALPPVGVTTLDAIVDRSLAQERLLFTLLAVFAVIAVTLSAVGTYGVVSSFVSARTTEIGVRMALGARRSGVLRLVFGATLAPISVGLLIGLGSIAAFSPVIRATLFGVSPLDPRLLIGAATILTLVACAACALPAWRAARVDPLAAIRQ